MLLLQLNRQWYENGVLLVGDFLDKNAEMLELEDLHASLGLKVYLIQKGEMKVG